MQKSNPLDEAFFKGSLDYAKASDLCEALYSSKLDTKYQAVEGYDPSKTKWFDRAMHFAGILPPKDEWGKARLHNHSKYNESIDNWYISASDVTRVLLNAAGYESQQDF